MPDRFCGPESLLFSTYHGLFRRRQNNQCVKLAFHCNPVRRLRMCVFIILATPHVFVALSLTKWAYLPLYAFRFSWCVLVKWWSWGLLTVWDDVSVRMHRRNVLPMFSKWLLKHPPNLVTPKTEATHSSETLK